MFKIIKEFKVFLIGRLARAKDKSTLTQLSVVAFHWLLKLLRHIKVTFYEPLTSTHYNNQSPPPYEWNTIRLYGCRSESVNIKSMNWCLFSLLWLLLNHFVGYSYWPILSRIMDLNIFFNLVLKCLFLVGFQN